ncbi:peptidoglycan-binding protein [Streptomyces sp. NPDC093089]|uniref:peptidoglycan-binding protein n=1 Tax=Streptomyces sp. NPDC093089 TaxID=3366024 RepID=UPI00382AEBED
MSELPSLDVAGLPLVLAGPIVRRVDQSSATVWLALKAPRKVTLDVYEGASGPLPATPTLTGTRVTARIGEHLHIVAVTATVPSGGTLRPGAIHRYALRFGEDLSAPTVPVAAGSPGLFTPQVIAATEDAARAALLYQGTSGAPTLPSFVTPPDRPGALRLFHASCRKPHAEGTDALSILDEVLKADAGSAERRPQQLILTGDQIYADDVADGLLHMCTEYGKALLGRDETFPTVHPASQKWSFRPGWRQEMILTDFHMTSTAARSHLLRLSEFLAMYLFVWSPALWPAVSPVRFFAELFPKESAALGDPDHTEFFGLRDKPQYKKAHERLMDYVAECDRVDGFRGTLGMVRRALANTATYMMFDDHEITDDWFISKKWVHEVCGTVHGRQFLGNGMAAYAVCQGWGNTPEQFADGPRGEAGRELLTALAAPDHTAAGPAAVIARRTGTPSDVDPAGRIVRQDGSLTWHYAITWAAHQLVCVDTRTQRVFRGGFTDPPSLVYSDAAFASMIEAPADQGLEKVTVLLSPCPVLGDPVIEEFAQPAVRRIQGYAGQLDQDYEAWGHDPRAFEKFIARVLGHAAPGADGVRRRRVVSLGGDVHYGFAARMAYRAAAPFGSAPGQVRGVLAQLTASSLKNQATGTMLLHHMGFNLSNISLPSARRAGWANPSGDPLKVRTYDHAGEPSGVTYAHESPAVLDLVEGTTVYSPQPEWEYELAYYRHDDPDGTAPRPGGPAPVSFPATGDRRAALAQYVQAADNHLDYLRVTGSGREIVGRNNIGEVQFTWDGQDAKSVVQTLWWHLPGNQNGAPLTRLVVPLDVGQTTGAPPSTLPDLYGGTTLREGDTDASTGGGTTGLTAATHVTALQRDLQELGFGVVGARDGSFGREVRWAVRELQAYAKMARVARVATAVVRLAQPLTDTATTATLTAPAGGTLPELPFKARVGDENLTVTAVSGTTWTVSRASDGTGAAAHPAGDAVTVLRDQRWASALEGVEVPAARRFTGEVSGVADTATRQVIARWKADGLRCPVVVEAWRNASGSTPSAVAVIAATGTRPARLADNVWRWDETANNSVTSPKMFARDFTDHWTRPATRPADSWEPDRRTPIGQRVPYDDPSLAAGDPYRPMSGPVGYPERGHTWAPEAEMTPEALIGTPLRDLDADTLATYKVIRAVAEVEALGYFDAVNCYDHAFASLGLCHWTFGARVYVPATQPGRPARALWKVDDGELWAFLAYLRTRNEASFQKVAGLFGVRPDRAWVGDGQTGDPAPWVAGQRKYAARGVLTRQDGSTAPLHGFPAPGPGVTQVYGQYAEHEYFKTWHWYYRFVMAGRTDDGFRRAMWDMARMRLRDLRSVPWNHPTATNPFPLQAGTTIGDVFRSEKTAALLHRWHVFSPAVLLRGAPARASVRLQEVVQRAAADSGLAFGPDPSTWTAAHEAALAAAILAKNPCPRTPTSSTDVVEPHPANHGYHAGYKDPGHTLRVVNEWPDWFGGSNPRHYTLPLADLPADQRTLRTARDFTLDTQGLPS